MQITASQIKDIKTALAALKPQKVTLDGNRPMTVKEAVFALAPTLERMKKRGFEMEELVTKLHEKGVPVKAPTLAKYLNEFRRSKGKKAESKIDTSLLSMPVRLEASPTGTASPPSVGPQPPLQKTTPAIQPDKPATALRGWFNAIPDTPLEDFEHGPAPQTYKRPSYNQGAVFITRLHTENGVSQSCERHQDRLRHVKPQKVTLDGNRPMTVKEAVFALAPTLERMKKRGFDMEELVTKLHEKGVPVKAPTLAKYLNEYRRVKGKKAEGKIDTPPPLQA